ncbi:MAG: hypothetical protein PHS51_03195 [Gallionella sp.]|nr:hypothetical protein [Gallionella sp.]
MNEIRNPLFNLLDNDTFESLFTPCRNSNLLGLRQIALDDKTVSIQTCIWFPHSNPKQASHSRQKTQVVAKSTI